MLSPKQPLVTRGQLVSASQHLGGPVPARKPAEPERSAQKFTGAAADGTRSSTRPGPMQPERRGVVYDAAWSDAAWSDAAWASAAWSDAAWASVTWATAAWSDAAWSDAAWADAAWADSAADDGPASTDQTTIDPATRDAAIAALGSVDPACDPTISTCGPTGALLP